MCELPRGDGGMMPTYKITHTIEAADMERALEIARVLYPGFTSVEKAEEGEDE